MLVPADRTGPQVGKFCRVDVNEDLRLSLPALGFGVAHPPITDFGALHGLDGADHRREFVPFPTFIAGAGLKPEQRLQRKGRHERTYHA